MKLSNLWEKKNIARDNLDEVLEELKILVISLLKTIEKRMQSFRIEKDTIILLMEQYNDPEEEDLSERIVLKWDRDDGYKFVGQCYFKIDGKFQWVDRDGYVFALDKKKYDKVKRIEDLTGEMIFTIASVFVEETKAWKK